MRAIRYWFASSLIVAQVVAGSDSYPGVTVLQHPGGGTIAYAPMPQQHTARGAIGRVMGYVQARFGARPTVTHVLKSSDGNSLAVTFTVKATTESAGDVTGLALVAVSASGPGRGAVLSDRSDRFGTTVGDMLKQMRQIAAGDGSDGAAPPASAAAPVARAEFAATQATASAAPDGASAASKGSGTATRIGPLHPTRFPDGSGTIGLPDGWKIRDARAGEVIAEGPAPAAVHFDFQVGAYDPNDPQAAGFRFVPRLHPIPYDADVNTKLDLLNAQMARMNHTTAPSVKVLATQKIAANNFIIMADVNPTNGRPTRMWTQVLVSPNTPGAGYMMTLYQVILPQQISEADGTAAAKAFFSSYQANTQVVKTELGNDKARSDQSVAMWQRKTAESQAFTDRTIANMDRSFDAQARSFAADDYELLGNTVVRDRDYNEHGLVSDNLADALTQADPNRFQEVPPSQYVKGVDY